MKPQQILEVFPWNRVLYALGVIEDQLSELDHDEKIRVLKYFNHKYPGATY